MRWLAVAALIAPESPAVSSLWVVADVANVRAEAADQAPIVAKLRISTHVTATGNPTNGWTAVTWGWGADVKPGFVRSELLAAEPLLEEAALAKARAAREARDLVEATRWAERAAALNPDATANLEMVRDLHREAGKKEKAAAIDELLAGKRAAYIAVCRAKPSDAHFPAGPGPRIELLGRVGADGEPQLLRDEELAALAIDLGAAPWWVVSASGRVSLANDGFPAARPVAVWNEDPSGGGEMSGSQRKIILGPCNEPGAVLSSLKPKALFRGAYDWSKTASLVGSARKGIAALSDARIRSVSAGGITPAVTEVLIDVDTVTNSAFEGAAPMVRTRSWALVERGTSVRESIGPTLHSSWVGMTDPVWMELPGGRRVATVLYEVAQQESGSTAMGAVVVIDAKGTIRRVDTEIEGSGC